MLLGGSDFFIGVDNFMPFISKLIEKNKLIGPIQNKNKFIFAPIEWANLLRLDYDVSILPPKKEIFPTEQNLCKFDNDKYEGCINAEEKILFGVHFYDQKAIDMTDFLFSENKKDINYIANREAITIVGSNIQKISERSFWGSIGKDKQAKGYDAFLTKIEKGYLFQVYSKKGKKLLKFGDFQKASSEQIEEAKKVNGEILNKCNKQLKYSSEEIAEKIRKSFKNNSLWEEFAKYCFSCGSCNIVCPTCYCFDVQDYWNIDQKSGVRARYWDACLTEDFAKISLGAGNTENFRENSADRFRHRIMRKAVYLNEKLNSPACVGCGRCSQACTADIADPVEIINKIMEV